MDYFANNTFLVTGGAGFLGSYVVDGLRQRNAKRFWERVDIRSNDECWHWNASRQTDGYGTVWINKRCYLAHRMAYLMAYQELPDGMCVCHSCDNPPCCNPFHLWLGTHTDNMRDRGAKNHINVRGEKNPRSKLSEAQVIGMRQEYARSNGSVSFAELGRRYGVSDVTASMIIRGKIWKHLPLL